MAGNPVCFIASFHPNPDPLPFHIGDLNTGHRRLPGWHRAAGRAAIFSTVRTKPTPMIYILPEASA